ncbi:hypothetical protein EK21DRAFT_73289 [Setomelanomma holmii]|uniref:Uncharacterized protein n=1 Tax=Setomelanomma holmii TaxID=210430 RepID=A0A9P4H1V7_9PLEO|nr:hypothetical protein EK21DRAFT_73289 [Setomelanomma holmii]
MADAEQDYALSQEQIDHFLEHGWIKLSNCFSKEQAASLQKTLWTRLGMDPEDISTWHTERTNMPFFNEFLVSDFAPKAWAGICSLLGGSARVDDNASTWKDGFIVNLGTPAGHNAVIKPQELPGWHVDGDFFVHYLDSPEQALLVIPLWSDVVAGGGGTFICPRAIETVAKWLYENPEGVSPRMTPRAQNPTFVQEKGLKWFNELAASMPDDAFVEATGVVGDVYLLHPLMLHSASNNQLRKARVITNPPVSVKEPFVFDREHGAYSAVERKTLKALGKERLEGWGIKADRQKVVPERVRIQEEMKRKEEERLRKLKEGSGSAIEASQRVEGVGA